MEKWSLDMFGFSVPIRAAQSDVADDLILSTRSICSRSRPKYRRRAVLCTEYSVQVHTLTVDAKNKNSTEYYVLYAGEG